MKNSGILNLFTTLLVGMVVVFAISSCSNEDIEPREIKKYDVTYQLINYQQNPENFHMVLRDPAFGNLVHINRDSILNWSYTCEMETFDVAFIKAGLYADSAHFEVRISVDTILLTRDSLYVPPIGVKDSVLIDTEYMLP